MYFSVPVLSHAIDVEPGGYAAGPSGANAVGIYYQHATRNGIYINGDKAPNNPQLDSDTVLVKYGHSMSLGEHTVMPGFAFSCGHFKASRDIAVYGSTRGCSDLIAGGIYWVINQPARNEYFGIAPYVSMPIGNYDKNKPLNTGENRWKLGINSGYITPLSEKFIVDLVGDILWHGKNTEFGPSSSTLKQGVIYNAQLHLRYQIDKTTRLQASYLHDWGGERSINGTPQHDRKNQGRYRIGGAKWIDAHNQVQLEVGADTSVMNGYKENGRFIFRYVNLF